MHVCMVLPNGYPPDIRVEKEVGTLTEAGHDVTLLCRAAGDRPPEERIDGVRVVRVGATRGERLALLPSAAGNLLTGVHWLWSHKLDRLLREDDVDLVHAHDLPPVRMCVRAGARHDVPVVADLHENFPEAVRQWREPHGGIGLLGKPAHLLKRTFMPVSRYKRIERRTLPRTDHVLTVAAEAKAHYVEDCDVPANRVTIVGNTVDRTQFDPESVDPVTRIPDTAAPETGSPEAVAPGTDSSEGEASRTGTSAGAVTTALDDGFVATYVGGFGPHRGLHTVVRALGRLDDVSPEPELLLVGAGPDAYERRLREIAEAEGVSDRVHTTGWVDFAEVPGYVAGSDVCLVPHASNPHTNTTVPHKLFQYMAMGKPVVVSNADPLARIVSETESGLVVPAGDATEMARALGRLAESPSEAAAFGENGRRAVDRRYNWSIDGDRLLSVYDDLV